MKRPASSRTASRVVLVAIATFCVLTFWFWPAPEGQGVRPRPPADPRTGDGEFAGVHGADNIDNVVDVDVDAGAGASDDAFAAALTAHTGVVYSGDLDAIRARGVLRVLTRNNASSYFLYRGVERGFDYELAVRFADSLGVRLQMVVAPTRKHLIPWLLQGRGDVVFAGLSFRDESGGDRVAYSSPYADLRWVVVVQKRAFPDAKKKPPPLDTLRLLAHPSSSILHTIGLPPQRVEFAAPDAESEDLLDEVADTGGDLAAVVEEHVADVELLHRKDLVVAHRFDTSDAAAFCARAKDTALVDALNRFVDAGRGSAEWLALDRRYHKDPFTTRVAVSDAVRADKDGRLTPYDDDFRAAARAVVVDDGVVLDWRLLAAVAVQESGLDPEAESPYGARGLMQLLPSTAHENGCDDVDDPACSARAAARYLGRLAASFRTPYPVTVVDVDGGVTVVDADHVVPLKDRMRFALAAYNAGVAHVDDARALALAEGKDPDRWFGHVEVAMQHLERPRHYAQARHGFARGSETVDFVSEVQSRFDVYASLVADDR